MGDNIRPDTVLKALLFSISLVFFMMPSQASETPLKWKLEGLSGELKNNTSLYLEALPDIDRAQFSGFRPRITEEVKHSLQAHGLLPVKKLPFTRRALTRIRSLSP